ncbi:MAG: response regulator, partial [Treponema sp.]|nr:response regulator [Treponema sp.]
ECWILSSYGLFNVKSEDLFTNTIHDYRLYTIANGLPCAITSNSYSTLIADGTLYIPGREGVVRVNINHYFERSSQLKVELNAIFCDDQKVFPNQNGVFVLPASKGRIRLAPSVMDYTMANPVIRVYLDGAKDAGIMVFRNELMPLEYTALSYGTYRLHIQVLDHNKRDVLLDKSFEIIKRPRFAELFVFRMSLLAFLFLAAGFIVWRVMKSTVISRQYEEIRQAKDEAERANSAKSRFLSNMSQEILHPINTILGMNEMIMREEAKDVPKAYFLSVLNYASDIKNAANSLYTLVNDVLELTKIESGKLALVEQEYDVRALLVNLVSFIQAKTKEKELAFEVNVDEMIPRRLYGDAGKIKQIVLKLLTNAVTYTEEGSIIISVSMESRNDAVCGLRFSVRDTGIGINQEEVEMLFSSYENIVGVENRENMRNGLGLNISRRFAELMGGVLVCQSNPGTGSEFILAFEQRIIDATPVGVFTGREEAFGQGPYLPQFIAPDADILVIDDNPMTVTVIRNLLKATKVFVTTVSTCEDGLVNIRNNTFNVVFLSKDIPGMDGESAIQKIREIAPELPVYALTENAASSAEFFQSLGYTGCLQIPIDFGLMERTIMRHLSESMMAHPSKNDKIEQLSEIPASLLWLNDVEEISVPAGITFSGDIGSFIFAVNLFYQTIDDTIKGFNHAFKSGDLEMYAAKARMLKTSARYIGAERLCKLAESMEEACLKKDMIFVAANTEKLLSDYRAFKEKFRRLEKPEGAEHV